VEESGKLDAVTLLRATPLSVNRTVYDPGRRFSIR
jgi:hypothetical protein